MGKIDIDSFVLFEVSTVIQNLSESIHLAIKLKVPPINVRRLLVSSFRQETALGILRRWKSASRQDATGAVLFAALVLMGKKDMVKEHFAKKLLGDGESVEPAVSSSRPMLPPRLWTVNSLSLTVQTGTYLYVNLDKLVPV